MRAYVALPQGLSASDWAVRHDRDEVPDASPYGLHQLADHGITVEFSRARTGSPFRERVAASVRYRLSGAELTEALGDLPARSRRRTDVVLCYDERTGVPAGLLAAAALSAPVATGVGWLTTPASAGRAFAALARIALPRAGAVWAQSPALIPALRMRWHVPESRLHFVPTGIDTDFYALQTAPPEPGLVVGAGEDRGRDHPLLIAAVAQLRRSVPSARLELATGLPVDLPADLGTLHTGRLDGRMRELYRRACVVGVALKPTATGSGLTVILEAMASGRAVVATGNPGLRAYVQDGVTGVLVPPGDVDAFASALGGLLADPDRAAEMGHRAAAVARENFTSRIMVSHLARIVHGM